MFPYLAKLAIILAGFFQSTPAQVVTPFDPIPTEERIVSYTAATPDEFQNDQQINTIVYKKAPLSLVKVFNN